MKSPEESKIEFVLGEPKTWINSQWEEKLNRIELEPWNNNLRVMNTCDEEYEYSMRSLKTTNEIDKRKEEKYSWLYEETTYDFEEILNSSTTSRV